MIEIDGVEYKVVVNRKLIKNAYIRVNSDLEIVVSANRFVPMFEINKLIKNNILIIKKMIKSQKVKQEKASKYFYLGEEYNVILNDSFFEIDHDNKKIYTKSISMVDKELKKHTSVLFEERLKYNYDYVGFDIKYPTLKIRKMTSRWGVCNRRNHTITLNSELFKYTLKEIDYVIIHELCHFKVFDHSKKFWDLVLVYCPDYKKIRKILKE